MESQEAESNSCDRIRKCLWRNYECMGRLKEIIGLVKALALATVRNHHHSQERRSKGSADTWLNPTEPQADEDAFTRGCSQEGVQQMPETLHGSREGAGRERKGVFHGGTQLETSPQGSLACFPKCFQEHWTGQRRPIPRWGWQWKIISIF